MSRASTVKLSVVLATIVASLSLLSGSAAAAPWVWSAPKNVDSVPFVGLACPSAKLCLAVDADGRIVRSANPGGGRRAWSGVATDPDGPMVGISCAGTSLCVAVDGQGGAFVSTNPGNGATWQRAVIDSGQRPTGVSCPATRLCVVADGDQSVITSINPAGGSAAWSRAPIDTGTDTSCIQYEEVCGLSLTGVACPNPHFCATVDNQGNVLTSNEPTGGPGDWAVNEVDSEAAEAYGLITLSCPSKALCVSADDYDGDILSSTDPAGGATQWVISPVSFSPGWLSCPLTTLCVANDGAPPNFVATDPTGPGSAWKMSPLAPNAGVTGMACPTRSSCVAVDSNGDIITGVPGSLPAPVRGHGPTIVGRTTVGSQLTASSGRWTGGGTLRYAYQWQACVKSCRPIAGARARTLRLTMAVQGKRVQVVVTATNGNGSASQASLRTARIAAAPSH